MRHNAKKRLPPTFLNTPRNCEPVLATCWYCGAVTKCKSFYHTELSDDYKHLVNKGYIYLCAKNEPGIIAKL